MKAIKIIAIFLVLCTGVVGCLSFLNHTSHNLSLIPDRYYDNSITPIKVTDQNTWSDFYNKAGNNVYNRSSYPNIKGSTDLHSYTYFYYDSC